MKPFIVYSDHLPICHLQASKASSGRLSRWATRLLDYPYMKLVYRPGLKNVDADALSRLPVEPAPEGEDEAIEFPVLIMTDAERKEYLQNFDHTTVMDIEADSMGELQKDDAFCMDIVRRLGRKDKQAVKRFQLIGKVLYFVGTGELRLVVPRVLIRDVLQECHNSPLSAHQGISKTYERIRQRFIRIFAAYTGARKSICHVGN